MLLAFGQQWQFNAGLFALFASALGDAAARVLFLGATLAAVLAMLNRVRRSPAETSVPSAVVLALALPLLLGPVVNAWYLIWLLPLVAGKSLPLRALDRLRRGSARLWHALQSRLDAH